MSAKQYCLIFLTLLIQTMFHQELRKIGIDVSLSARGKVAMKCPKCSEGRKKSSAKCLTVNPDEGWYKCNHAGCGWKGRVFLKEYKRPEWRNNTDLSASTVRFFENRGISQKTLSKLSVSENKGSIEFNYFRGDQLINIKARSKDKRFFQTPGAEKIVYNLNSLKSKTKCIITEGEIDALSWIEAGVSHEYAIISLDQGAGVEGSVLDGKLECLKNCALELDKIEEFYLSMDNDGPGKWMEKELIRRLGEHRCFTVEFPSKDANDVLQNKNQTDDVNKEQLRNILRNAEPVPVPGIQILDSELWDQMTDYYDNGRPKGMTTHYEFEFNKHFSFLSGDITLITGIPGDGKGQFLRQLMVLKAHFDNWKFACYVPEDYPIDIFYDDLCHIYIGLTSDRDFQNRMSKEQYTEARLFVREHFFGIYPTPNEFGKIDLPTNDWINERIKFLKLKYGVNAYVKDPWNKIHHTINAREDQYLQQEISKEKFFASGYDACLYVAHPTKLYKDKAGNLPAPDAYKISGGAMFNNMFDNILTVYRPSRHAANSDPSDKLVEVISQKIKKQKLVGRLGTSYFGYDWKKNRYYELLGEILQPHPMESKGQPISDDDDLPF